MVLVRLAYAADLPTPEEALRALGDDGAGGGAPVSGGGGSAGSTPRMAMAAEGGGARVQANPQAQREPKASAAPVLARLEDIAALASNMRDLKMKHAIEN